MQYHSYSNEEGRNIIVTDSLLTPEVNGATCDLKKTQYELRKLMKKDMEHKWNIVSLSDYWRAERIPRGLRMNKFPATKGDASFKDKWEAILNKCSMDLMLLIIEDGKKQREELQTQIALIESSMHLTPEQSAPFYKKITDDIHRAEEDLKAKKAEKFQRDAEDYQQDRVYKWDKPPRTPRSSRPASRNQQRRPASSSRSVSFNLSQASTDDEMTTNASTDQDTFLDQDWPPSQSVNNTTVDRRHAGGGAAVSHPQSQQQPPPPRRQQQRRLASQLSTRQTTPREQPRKQYYPRR